MPIVGALFGAIMLGLVYWIMFGGGLSYIGAMLDGRDERKRREKSAQRRIEVAKEAATAPMRSLTDPREAATALMVAAAMCRGDLTPEQEAAIKDQMGRVLEITEDVGNRLSFCRFAAERAESPEATIDEVVPALRAALEPAEREDVRAMLEAVTAVHGGPTERQEKFVALAMRRLTAA